MTRAAPHELPGHLATPRPVLSGRLLEIDRHLAREREHILDVEELAAYMEADGVGDDILKNTRGHAGLFSAAELLYRQEGTGRAANRVAWTVAPNFPWQMLLRGPLYLPSGVAGLLIAQQLGMGAAAAFIFASAFGWGWTMAVAGVRYSEPFAVPGRALRMTLLIGGVVGVLGGALCAGTLIGADTALVGALMGGAVSLAIAASGILLSLGRIVPLIASYAAPVLAALLLLVWPSVAVTAAALALLALVPAGVALHATRPVGLLPARWSTVRPHLHHAIYGWSMATAFVVLTFRLGAWTLLPIVLSAGLLEAGVWHAQDWLKTATRGSRDLRALRRTGLWAVLLCTGGYGVALAVWTALAGALPLPESIRPQAGALYLVPLFGAGLLLSAWLSNQRLTRPLAGIWTLCAAGLFLNLSLAIVAAALLLILMLPTVQALSDPRSYR